MVLSQRVSLVIGPLIGTGLIAWTSTTGVFLFDGLTFVVSALSLLGLRASAVIAPARLSGTAGEPDPGASSLPEMSHHPPGGWRAMKALFGDIHEGIRFVLGVRWLWIGVLIGAVSNIGFAAAIGVAEPKLVRDVYGAGAWLLGLLNATNSLGVILATLLIGQMGRLHRRGVRSYLGTLLAGLALAAFGLPLPPGSAPVLLSLASATFGFGMGLSGLLGSTLEQELVPAEKLGRVSSIEMLASFSLIPVGIALGGVFTDQIGPRWIYLTSGSVIVGLALLALASEDIRKLD
jgi:hypothetical protein